MSLQLKFRRVPSSFAVIFVAMTIVVSSYFLLSPLLTKATDPSWVASANPEFEKQEIPSEPTILNCDPVTKILEGVGAKDVCLTRGKHLNFARYYEPAEGVRNYISFGGESKMYRIKGLPSSSYVYLLENTDSIVMRWFSNGSDPHPGSSLLKYNSLAEHLVRKTDDGIYYQFNNADPDFRLKKEDGSPLSITTLRTSNNGKWLIARTSGNAFIRIESSTNTATVIDRIRFAQPNADPDLGVSNDGRYLALGGYASPFYMYDTVGGCGDPINHLIDADDQPLTNPCMKKDYTQFEKQQLGGGLDRFHSPYFMFNDDATSLEFHTFKTSNTNISTLVTLTMPGYTPPPGLDYLALGDSYSSGEGDTEKDVNGNKYYRPWTNMEENQAAGQPREKCHISTRSYPYLLAQSMDLAMDDPKQWDSVACSGATAWDVKEQGSDDYKGQIKGGALLWSIDGQEERLKNYDSVALKWNALNEFIPGRQKQVEFMKTYRPRAVTLTMGGNDVGFSGKMSNCVSSLDTCGTATEQGRKDLGQELQGQFKNLTSLYRELQVASPSTKIYILGYPQIINGNSSDLDCLGYSIGGLDGSERRVIAEAVSYLNQVIEAAAKNTGVKYINIEDALDGHRVCDGLLNEHYVTGVTFGNQFQQTNERQESFHPNARGNEAISNKIEQRIEDGSSAYTLLTYPYSQQEDRSVVAPAPSEYLASATSASKIVETQHMLADGVMKGVSVQVNVNPYLLGVNSIAKLILHSDPINLGEYTVSIDGSLNVNITIPDSVPAGYHTLILTGKTYSGEPIQYEQVIFVHGANLNDIDEDNVSDAADPCLFIAPVNTDQDQDGQDDACDLQITEPPISQDPYRIRAGNPTRTYAGQPEAANALYLERNVNTTAQTGVAGDYDPDHDGWVIVATNQPSSTTSNSSSSSSPPLTPYAKFWLQDITTGSGSTATTTKLPHLSFRTKENGCAQYKPTNLTKVTEAEVTSATPIPRTFTQEATDTNTCRSESPDTDTDNNGQPDNTQPLYRARNGNPAITHTKPDGTTYAENPTKLYLERSTRAAEAQVGKSDYAPTDPTLLPLTTVPPTPLSPTDTKDYRQAWSLLATTPYPNYALTNFTKLKFINNYPYALSGYSSQFYTSCSAYKPESTGTIKQSTQSTRALQIDLMQTLTLQLQGGCNG